MRISEEKINTRKIQILKELVSRSLVTTEEITEKFHYQNTKLAWQDIDRLHKEGLVQKTRGGVCSKFFGVKDSAFQRRSKEGAEKKKAIADFVIGEYLIRKSCGEKLVVYLDAGSTIETLYRELLLHPSIGEMDLTIVSNNVALADYHLPENVKFYLTGGRYLYEERCLVDKAGEFFQKFRARLAFLSSSNLSYTGGFLGHNFSECEVKRAMIANAEQIFILVDESKFKICGGELIAKFKWVTRNDGSGLMLESQGSDKAVKIISNECSSGQQEKILKEFQGGDPGVNTKDVDRSIIFAPYNEHGEIGMQ